MSAVMVSSIHPWAESCKTTQWHCSAAGEHGQHKLVARMLYYRGVRKARGRGAWPEISCYGQWQPMKCICISWGACHLVCPLYLKYNLIRFKRRRGLGFSSMILLPSSLCVFLIHYLSNNMGDFSVCVHSSVSFFCFLCSLHFTNFPMKIQKHISTPALFVNC